MKFAVFLLLSASAFAQNSLVLVQAPVNQPYTSIHSDTIIIGASAGAPATTLTVTSFVPWATLHNGPCGTTPGNTLVRGMTPFTLTVCIDPTQIPGEGYYVAVLQAAAPAYLGLRIPLNVTKLPAGDLLATPALVQLTSAINSLPITVKADANGAHNPGGAPLAFTSSLGVDDSSEGDWLTIQQPSNTTPGIVIATADPAKLTSPVVGHPYYKTVGLQDSFGDRAEVTVSLTLTQGDIVNQTLIPHFAIGGEYTTGFYILNNSALDARFQIDFHDDNGLPIALPLSGGLQNSFSSVVPKNGSQYYEFGNITFPVTGGSALVTAPSTILVQGVFRHHGSDGSYYEASVPATGGLRGFRTAFDATTFAATGEPFYTGLAVANFDSTASATVTCTAVDSSGRVIPNALSIPVLKPLGHWADYRFPALTGLRGTIDCDSTTTIGVTALRFIGTNSLAALPVIPK